MPYERVSAPPIFPEDRTKTYEGAHPVRLYIPSTSTLTRKEIDRILRISSWDEDPNKADGFEGARSVLLRRERSIWKGTEEDVELGGLQINGIGYKKMDFSTSIPTISGDFYPPSARNLMDQLTGSLMSTSYAQEEQLMEDHPAYKPLGTYTYNSLNTKVTKTQRAAQIAMQTRLEMLVVPHVEAYGRYLDPALQNEEGPFGFVVLPVPDPEKQRAANDLCRPIIDALASRSLTPVEETVTYFCNAFSHYVAALAVALRELHDKCRLVHLQTHMENYYVLKTATGLKIYLMDWSTSKELGDNKTENILNRTIDLMRPTEDYANIFSGFFGSFVPEFIRSKMELRMIELAMKAYSGDYDKEISLIEFSNKHAGILGGKPSDMDVVVAWMKSKGIEGYRKSDLVRVPKKAKVGRNELCPCGSGVKYKNCCGTPSKLRKSDACEPDS